MAKPITLTRTGGNAPFADGGLKLSKNILLHEIEEHPQFKALYKIDAALLDRITHSIEENGFDNSQPVHIWFVTDSDGTLHKYLIDGYTRKEAAATAGKIAIPYYEHHFNSFDDAYRYVLSLQVNRRNLDGSELLKNISILMGTEFIQAAEGSKSEAIAEVLGVSQRTAERAMSVKQNATDEQLARIESGTASVNQIYKENHKKKTKKDRADCTPPEEPFTDYGEQDEADLPGQQHFEFAAEQEQASGDNTTVSADEMDMGIDFIPDDSSETSLSENEEISLYEKIQEMELDELAGYLCKIQTNPALTAAEWSSALAAPAEEDVHASENQ